MIGYASGKYYEYIPWHVTPRYVDGCKAVYISSSGPTIPEPPETPGWLKDILRRFMMYVELKRRMRRMKRHMMPETVFGIPVIYCGPDLLTVEEARERNCVERSK